MENNIHKKKAMWQYLAAHGFLCDPAGTKLEPFIRRFEAIEPIER